MFFWENIINNIGRYNSIGGAQFTPERNISEIQAEIRKCIEIVSDKYEDNLGHALSLLLKNRSALEKEPDILKDLVKTFIANGSAITSEEDALSSPNYAFRCLDEFKMVLDAETVKSLAKTLITNSIAIKSDGSDIMCLQIALLCLSKFKIVLEVETFRDLIKTFITNCITIVPSGDDIICSRVALEYLHNFKAILGEETKDLVKTFITNCIKLTPNRENLIYPLAALQGLDKFKIELEAETFKDLIKTFITNCITTRFDGDGIICPSFAFQCLDKYKYILLNEEPDSYMNLVINIFNRDSGGYTSRLLSNHGEIISAEIIVAKYNSTNSILIINAIREYVQGTGAHRSINLPPRPDIIVQGRPLAGIAFEVHNFTNGIENVCIKMVDTILEEFGIEIPQFSLHDLRAKVSLIEHKSYQKLINQTIDKLLSMENYENKLNSVLPKICAFLDYDSKLWNHGCGTGQVRLMLWLQQSFLESANAYEGGGDTISCVKGIYERLFTGFRAMHPAIDILFCCKNIIKSYELNILNKLQELKDVVINKLKLENITGSSPNFESKLKAAYQKAIKESIMKVLSEEKAHFAKVLAEVPQTLKIAMSFLSATEDKEITDFINSCIDKISQLEWVVAPEGSNLDSLLDYIKAELQN